MIQKLVLENAVVDALLANPAARQEFKGCLDLIANAPKVGCSRCGKRPDASYYNQAKLCLATMGDEKRNRLKAMLNAKQVEALVLISGKPTPFRF
jgi:hypothetical protein